MPLTNERAIELLTKSTGRGGKTGTGNGEKYGMIDENGKLVTIHEKVPRESIGKHHGKAGTVKRSRKGVVRRNLNGERKYIAGGITEEKIVWYKV